MPDLQQYYKKIREAESQIPEPFVYIMSLEDDSRGHVGGGVTEVSRENAAKFIAGLKSHRLATPDEVEAFHKERAAQKKHFQQQQKIKLGSLLANALEGGEPEKPATVKPPAKQADPAK